MKQDHGAFAYMPGQEPQSWADWIERRLAAAVAIGGALAVVITIAIVARTAQATFADTLTFCVSSPVTCQ